MTKAQPAFFAAEADFRRWLERNHDQADELLVGFRKKATGRPSIDWPQARDQALCFGWIDGVRRSLGDDAYTIRFTPRRAKSEWSKVNVERFQALERAGLMTSPGRKAFAAGSRSNYAYEKAMASLAAEEEDRFRANAAAWTDWEKRPSGYRRTVLHWVTTAKKPETREKRLAELIAACEQGRKIRGYDIGKKPTAGSA